MVTSSIVVAGSLLELSRLLHRAAAGRRTSEVVLTPDQIRALADRVLAAANRAKTTSLQIAAALALMVAGLDMYEDGMPAGEVRDFARDLAGAAGLIAAWPSAARLAEVGQ